MNTKALCISAIAVMVPVILVSLLLLLGRIFKKKPGAIDPESNRAPHRKNGASSTDRTSYDELASKQDQQHTSSSAALLKIGNDQDASLYPSGLDSLQVGRMDDREYCRLKVKEMADALTDVEKDRVLEEDMLRSLEGRDDRTPGHWQLGTGVLKGPEAWWSISAASERPSIWVNLMRHLRSHIY